MPIKLSFSLRVKLHQLFTEDSNPLLGATFARREFLNAITLGKILPTYQHKIAKFFAHRVFEELKNDLLEPNDTAKQKQTAQEKLEEFFAAGIVASTKFTLLEIIKDENVVSTLDSGKMRLVLEHFIEKSYREFLASQTLSHQIPHDQIPLLNQLMITAKEKALDDYQKNPRRNEAVPMLVIVPLTFIVIYYLLNTLGILKSSYAVIGVSLLAAFAVTVAKTHKTMSELNYAILNAVDFSLAKPPGRPDSRMRRKGELDLDNDGDEKEMSDDKGVDEKEISHDEDADEKEVSFVPTLQWRTLSLPEKESKPVEEVQSQTKKPKRKHLGASQPSASSGEIKSVAPASPAKLNLDLLGSHYQGQDVQKNIEQVCLAPNYYAILDKRKMKEYIDTNDFNSLVKVFREGLLVSPQTKNGIVYVSNLSIYEVKDKSADLRFYGESYRIPDVGKVIVFSKCDKPMHGGKAKKSVLSAFLWNTSPVIPAPVPTRETDPRRVVAFRRN